MTSLFNPGLGKLHHPKAILCLCHDSNMLLIRRLLLEHFGYVVLPTTSVDEARSMAALQCPDMLLMDNGDPGMDYARLAEQVKQVCPDVITVVLSAYYRLSSTGAAGSIDRFVAKDDGPDALIAQIKELLEANESQHTHGFEP